MKRQIALDTETTGIDPESHRIIEIGCIELIDRQITGQKFHIYLNPQRLIDKAAFRVHGISNEFLQDKPLFKEVANDFIQFVTGAELLIHNAAFDIGFLEAELRRICWPHTIERFCSICDTLKLAREKHPGQRNSLDALCKRYDIDNSNRSLHGALLDAQILASVYLAMTGGQTNFFDDHFAGIPATDLSAALASPVNYNNIPVIAATPEELKRHEAFLAFLEKNH